MVCENSAKSDILMGLADRPGGDVTARLLLALTVLYAEKPAHSPEEQRQYIELALRLIDRVDETTRATVADILRAHAAAPAEVLAAATLPTNGCSGRAPTSEIVSATSAEPAVATVEPVTAPAALPVRDDSQLGDAFFAAPTAERRRLLSLLPHDPVTEATGFPVSPEAAEQFYAPLDTAALQGRIGEFIREFERRLALPKSLCERIVNDGSGEPMAVAARAANIPIAVLQRILLLVNPAVSHSVQRVYDLTDLYHGLDRGAAIRLLALWRVQAKPNDPAAAVVAERAPIGLRDLSSAALRARFGALAARVQDQVPGQIAGQVQDQGVSQRSDPENVARRGLRSR